MTKNWRWFISKTLRDAVELHKQVTKLFAAQSDLLKPSRVEELQNALDALKAKLTGPVDKIKLLDEMDAMMIVADRVLLPYPDPKARDWVERAHQTSDRFGNQFHRAETYRVQADILNEASPDEAIACALQAVETAQAQNALAHELRATTTLAELRQRGGRKTEAITILEAVCQRVREGHATPDFRDATALLDQLKH